MSMGHMSIIPALKRLRMEHYYLETNLGYMFLVLSQKPKTKNVYIITLICQKTCWEKKEQKHWESNSFPKYHGSKCEQTS